MIDLIVAMSFKNFSERRIRQVKKILYRLMSVKGEQRIRSYRGILSRVQLLINKTPSPSALRGWTPEQVVKDPQRKGAAVLHWNEQQRMRRFKHLIGRPFGFLLKDTVRIQMRPSTL